MAVRAPAVHAACEARLSAALRAALRTVRERVLVDALPLLSLVQSEPLRLQSSHLSFQETAGSHQGAHFLLPHILFFHSARDEAQLFRSDPNT